MIQRRLKLEGLCEEGYFYIPKDKYRKRLLSYHLVDSLGNLITEEELKNIHFRWVYERRDFKLNADYLVEKVYQTIEKLRVCIKHIRLDHLGISFEPNLNYILKVVGNKEEEEALLEEVRSNNEVTEKEIIKLRINAEIKKLNKELEELS